jgi:SNF2 family DNA or RNA helicase
MLSRLTFHFIFITRLKEDVEKSIPPKEETVIEVEMTPLQKQYYRAILTNNREFLNRGLDSKNVPNLLNVMMVRFNDSLFSFDFLV